MTTTNDLKMREIKQTLARVEQYPEGHVLSEEDMHAVTKAAHWLVTMPPTDNRETLRGRVKAILGMNDPTRDESPVAAAILELASAVSDIGPALDRLANSVDHTKEIGDLANAVDDLSQSVTRANE